jgi:hypothetical protein
MLENTPVDVTAIPARSTGNRARIDGRSAAARRAKQLTGQYVAALGGPDAIDPVMLSSIRRAAALVTIAEWHRTEALKGGDVLLDDLVRLERLSELAVRRLGLGCKRERDALSSRSHAISPEPFGAIQGLRSAAVIRRILFASISCAARNCRRSPGSSLVPPSSDDAAADPELPHRIADKTIESN